VLLQGPPAALSSLPALLRNPAPCCCANFPCLASPHLQDCPEKPVFDAVMLWAGYGCEVEDGASACHPMQVGTVQCTGWWPLLPAACCRCPAILQVGSP